MRTELWPIITVNTLAIIIFGIRAYSIPNIEFLIYIPAIIIAAFLLYKSDSYAHYPKWVLWMLTSWSILHMAGGLVPTSAGVLYNNMLIPLVGDPYYILRYDQLLHAFGFFAATYTFWYILKPQLRKRKASIPLFLTLLFVGMGIGSMNELIELIPVIVLEHTNVGGYYNTMLDLLANTIGSFVAASLIYYRNKQ